MPETDEPAQTSAERPSDWAEFVPRLGVGEGDYIVTKRQWGAFSERIWIFSFGAGD